MPGGSTLYASRPGQLGHIWIDRSSRAAPFEDSYVYPIEAFEEFLAKLDQVEIDMLNIPDPSLSKP